MREDDNPPQVTCDGSGLCLSVDTCVITCKNFKASRANVVPVLYSAGVSERVCEDNLWGAYKYSQLIFPTNGKIMMVKMM